MMSVGLNYLLHFSQSVNQELLGMVWTVQVVGLVTGRDPWQCMDGDWRHDGCPGGPEV